MVSASFRQGMTTETNGGCSAAREATGACRPWLMFIATREPCVPGEVQRARRCGVARIPRARLAKGPDPAVGLVVDPAQRREVGIGGQAGTEGRVAPVVPLGRDELAADPTRLA